MYKAKAIILLSILSYCSTLQAQTDSTKQKRNIVDSVRKLQDVIVLAQKGINDKTPTIGKGNIVARDLPQLTQTIDKAVLDRQQVLKMSDLLQNTTGVYISGNTGGYQEEIASRGYAFSSNNTFKNGARFNNGVMPELSNVEKVEFLKGGAAILYGNVSPGGLMNIVTKKPKFEKGGELSLRVGSFDFIKPTIDLYGALGNSKKMAYRINSTFEKANSFRDKVHH
ncbi:MAG: TonB-dependent receptor plug domain-containing protein, partial [Sediminibacterium sp.]|nr:TonB-dependent receptor plug domain-containing protein [Sediminibacterium sp.]